MPPGANAAARRIGEHMDPSCVLKYLLIKRTVQDSVCLCVDAMDGWMDRCWMLVFEAIDKRDTHAIVEY